MVRENRGDERPKSNIEVSAAECQVSGAAHVFDFLVGSGTGSVPCVRGKLKACCVPIAELAARLGTSGRNVAFCSGIRQRKKQNLEKRKGEIDLGGKWFCTVKNWFQAIGFRTGELCRT